MKILVVGSLRDVPSRAGICAKFVRKLGKLIVDREYTLLTGCRGSLDKAIAEAAHNRLEAQQKNSRARLVGYRLRNAEPVHRLGKIHISARKDWELTHPELIPPEQISLADAAVFVAGREGTYIAANWARIAGIPVLGVAEFGGAGQTLYERECRDCEKKYGGSITHEDFEVLNQDTQDVGRLAADVISLAERIVMPRTVFPILPFTPEYRDVNTSFRDVCTELGFEFRGMLDSDSTERIIPRILEGIRRSALLIADVSEMRPNVFYELGFAQGLGKPVILTAKRGITLPFDLTDVPLISWDTQEDLKNTLEKRLSNVVRKTRRSGSASSARP